MTTRETSFYRNQLENHTLSSDDRRYSFGSPSRPRIHEFTVSAECLVTTKPGVSQLDPAACVAVPRLSSATARPGPAQNAGRSLGHEASYVWYATVFSVSFCFSSETSSTLEQSLGLVFSYARACFVVYKVC